MLLPLAGPGWQTACQPHEPPRPVYVCVMRVRERILRVGRDNRHNTPTRHGSQHGTGLAAASLSMQQPWLVTLTAHLQ